MAHSRWLKRQEEEKNRATKALTLLDTQIKKQEGRLEAARNNMIELMEERFMNIIHLIPPERFIRPTGPDLSYYCSMALIPSL